MIGEGNGGKIPLYRRISEEIRKDILSGIYEPGEILPSIRDEAKILGVARNTVDTAYQILADEGYIRSKRGIGYEVLDYRKSFNYEMDKAGKASGAASGDLNRGEVLLEASISARSCRLGPEAGKAVPAGSELVCDFRGRAKYTDLPPEKNWNILAAQIYRELQSVPADPVRSLRLAIRRYLKRHRGISCHEEQIFLFRNLHQAVQMIRKVQPHILYTIPHHEGAGGDHISSEEGKALILRLSEKDVYMVEDDIDSELVYDWRPYPTLFEEDTEDRVILTGTFERILRFNTQFQYVLFPRRMIDQNRQLFADMREETYHSLLELHCLAVMMNSDKWEGFLRKTNRSYAVKRDMVIRKLRECFGEEAVLYRTESGPEIIAALPFEGDSSSFMEESKNAGLGIEARTGSTGKTGAKRLYVTLHYAALSEEEICAGIDLLASVLRTFSNP